jgi:hypothetical protein
MLSSRTSSAIAFSSGISSVGGFKTGIATLDKNKIDS